MSHLRTGQKSILGSLNHKVLKQISVKFLSKNFKFSYEIWLLDLLNFIFYAKILIAGPFT
jgi:hypothetical protein